MMPNLESHDETARESSRPASREIRMLGSITRPGEEIIHIQCGDEELEEDLKRFAGPTGRVCALDARHPAFESRMAGLISSRRADVVVAISIYPLLSPVGQVVLLRSIRQALASDGRAVLSLIVSSAELGEAGRMNPSLAAEGLHGAVEKSAFIESVSSAGFGGIEIADCPRKPWIIREGIEFRPMTALLLSRAADPEAVPGEFVISEWTCGEAENAETSPMPFLSGVCRRGSDCC